MNKSLTAIKTSFLSLFMLTFLTLLSAPLTLAGGGGMYANVTHTEDPHWNIVRVYFDPNLYTCKGMVVSLNFENPIDGDKISGSNGDNSSTITNDASYETVNGKQYLRCSTYAKVYSPKLELNRLFNISYKGGRVEGSGTIAISFGSQIYHGGVQLLPWETPSDSGSTNPVAPNANINVWLLNQEMVSNSTRVVTIKWSAFDGNPATSTIFGTSDKNNWNFLVDHQRGPSANLKIPNEDYFIKLNGCVDKFGTCVDSNVIFIPKLNKDSGHIIPIPMPIPSSSPSDVQKDDLAQKVASLEAQLARSQKQQSALEQRVNTLVNFIKNIFPFFK